MPFDRAEFRSLKDRVEKSYDSLDAHRSNRLEALKSYCGTGYGDSLRVGRPETVVDLLELLVDVYLQQLVSGDPQVLVTTQRYQYRTTARYFEMALNHCLRRIDLRTSLQSFILESLFSIGVMKVGVTTLEEAAQYGDSEDGFLPFADPVFFDDFVYDTTVPRWSHIAFCGNRYEMLLEDLKNDPRNDKAALRGVGDGHSSKFRPGTMRAEELGVWESAMGDEDDDRPKVALWDIWLPREQVVVTYVEEGSEQRPLRIHEWDGPPKGPYHCLSYRTVLNNIQPVAPVNNMVVLADMMNRLWNKMGEQASRQKTLTLYSPSAQQDALRAKHASDGEMIQSLNPAGISQVRYGGVEQTTLAFSAQVREMFSYIAGNLDTMGGLAVGAPTATQEKLLAGASSNRMRSMQQRVIAATKAIITDIGWYLWNDPMVRMRLTSRVSGTDHEFETSWPEQTDELGITHDMRSGSFNDLNFSIEPYSMQDQSPQERAMLLRQIMQQDILPAIQLLMQQGTTIDFEAYFDKLAQYTNLPELKEFIRMGSIEATDPGIADMGPSKPPVTTRQYDRVSGGGMSRGGMDRALVAGLAGAGGNGSGSGITRGGR